MNLMVVSTFLSLAPFLHIPRLVFPSFLSCFRSSTVEAFKFYLRSFLPLFSRSTRILTFIPQDRRGAQERSQVLTVRAPYPNLRWSLDGCTVGNSTMSLKRFRFRIQAFFILHIQWSSRFYACSCTFLYTVMNAQR